MNEASSALITTFSPTLLNDNRGRMGICRVGGGWRSEPSTFIVTVSPLLSSSLLPSPYSTLVFHPYIYSSHPTRSSTQSSTSTTGISCRLLVHLRGCGSLFSVIIFVIFRSVILYFSSDTCKVCIEMSGHIISIHDISMTFPIPFVPEEQVIWYPFLQVVIRSTSFEISNDNGQ